MKRRDDRHPVRPQTLGGGKVLGELAARLMMQLFRYDKLNRAYEKYAHLGPKEFTGQIIEELQLKIRCDSCRDEKSLPKGAFISISNHPYGLVDSMIIIQHYLSRDRDIRLMGGAATEGLKPLQGLLLPYDEEGRAEAARHLDGGGALHVFPSGGVSTYQNEKDRISDGQWKNPILKFIRTRGLPVLPLHFTGSNSRTYHILGQLHPRLMAMKLPGEVFNKQNKEITLNTGKAISPAEQAELSDLGRYGRFLRSHVYALEAEKELPAKRFFETFLIKTKAEPLTAKISAKELNKEFSVLADDYLVAEHRAYAAICAPAADMPLLLQDIGRRRELMHRRMGRPTNKATDLSEYDLYHRHMLVWDRNKRQLAASMRLAMGGDIVPGFGVEGFYCSSLYRIKQKLSPLLKSTVETGRPYLNPDSKRGAALLWRSVLLYTIQLPEYNYLLGLISLDRHHGPRVKSLLSGFLAMFWAEQEWAEHISPRKKYRFATQADVDAEALLGQTNGQLTAFAETMNRLAPDYVLPPQLKGYLRLNARVVGLCRDPREASALDGLALIKMHELPVELIEGLSHEAGDPDIINRFNLTDVEDLGF